MPFEKITSEELLRPLSIFFEKEFTKQDLHAFRKVNEDVQKGKSAHFSMLPNFKKKIMKDELKTYIKQSLSDSSEVYQELQNAYYENPSN